MDAPISSFSVFVCELYAAKSFKSTANRLRFDSDMSVNILLYLIWLGCSGHGRLSKKQLREILALTTPWHQKVIVPLRQTYRLSAGESSDQLDFIRSAVKTELDRALAIERDMLVASQIKYQLSQRSRLSQLGDSCVNMSRFFEVKGEVLSSEDMQALELMCLAIFDDVKKQVVHEHLQGVFLVAPKNVNVEFAWDVF